MEKTFAFGKSRNVEFEFNSPAFGHQFFFSIFVPEYNEKGEVQSILAITRDISQLKEAQKRLSEAVREAKRRADEAEDGKRILNAMMDNIPEGIIVTDGEGKMLRISSYLAKFSGRDESEFIGKNFQVLDELLNDPSNLPDRRQTKREGKQVAGTAAAVVETLSVMSYPLGRALLKGEVTASEEYKVYLRDGIIRTVVINAAPLCDDKRIVGAVSSWRDITDRKKAEDAMRSSNRELEQFAYVASHDLQEPLRMVASFAELLDRRYHEQLDDRGRKYLAYIVSGSSRMQGLIEDLLTFSRIGRLDTDRHRVSLDRIINNVIADLSEKIRETHAEISIDPLPALSVNESSISRLFMNLISNALKFRRKDVPPKIHISVQYIGHEWRFSVRDNGIGIDSKYFNKLFIIFQRLHSREEYPGTGIGLAIAKKIVNNYGGRIWVESEPGKGSTFYFTISQ
jgi:signal transduction histidine kinase